MSIPLVSIIIPCYNSGDFLLEAILSVENYPDKNVYEIIITDDGSTEELTLHLLNDLKAKGYKILHQQNKGPASARNTAIRASQGQYLLFLDSDNKIRNNFIDIGIKMLNDYKDVGVVYGNAAFFGEMTETRFKGEDFDMEKMLANNYIDMCSMIKRAVWDELGPLDENPSIIGHEDWEYWIRVGGSRWKFLHIDECFFDYRVRSDSLVKQTLEVDRFNAMERYIYIKHIDLFIKNYKNLYHQSSVYEEDKRSPTRSFFKYMYYKYLKSK